MSTTCRAAVLLASVSLLTAGTGAAHADGASGLKSAGLAIGYVTPLACSAGTSVANGAYMAVDEGSPMYFRTAGVICGAVSIGVGTYVLIDDHDTGGRWALGIVPIGVGVTSIVMALIVGGPQDVVGSDSARLAPFVTADGGGGLAVTGRF